MAHPPTRANTEDPGNTLALKLIFPYQPAPACRQAHLQDASMKKLLTAFALGAVALTAMAQTKELKVAIDPTYEPFTFKTPDGKPTGFDVDIANAVCEHIKRKCVFVEQVWDSMIPGLQAKKYDTIISSMSITEDRLKVVDFTDKYYNTPSKIVVKNDIKFTDVASLKGKKIGVLKGSTQEKYANGELKKAGVVVTPYEAQDQVYLDIKSGRLDGTVADVLEVTGGFLSKPEGKDYGAVGPELFIPKYFGTGAGFALRKGDTALKTELNGAIKAIRANGTYKKINDKYFKIDVYGK
jgi:arginine/ornithine transport system substrate-binding protein